MSYRRTPPRRPLNPDRLERETLQSEQPGGGGVLDASVTHPVPSPAASVDAIVTDTFDETPAEPAVARSATGGNDPAPGTAPLGLDAAALAPAWTRALHPLLRPLANGPRRGWREPERQRWPERRS
jgi:hypothetical protein